MNISRVLLLIGFMLLAVAPAMADSVGAAEINLLNGVFNGYIGFSLGMLVAIGGIVTFARGNATGGLLMVLFGVLITLLPGLFNSLHGLMCEVVASLTTAKCGI